MKEKNEILKKRIITNTSKLFFDRGFSQVSMDEIAFGLGISKKRFIGISPARRLCYTRWSPI